MELKSVPTPPSSKQRGIAASLSPLGPNLTRIMYTFCLKCRRGPDTWLRSTSWVPLWIMLGFGVSRGTVPWRSPMHTDTSCALWCCYSSSCGEKGGVLWKRWVLSVRTQTERKGCLPGSLASRVIEPPWIPFRGSEAGVSANCSYQHALFSSL